MVLVALLASSCLFAGCEAHAEPALHTSVREFEQPVLCWQTEQFRVRVDRMPDGVLRYASWPREAALDAEPSLVLTGGEHRLDGSGGNEYYEWRNGAHTYLLSNLRVMTAEMDPMSLTVLKNGEKLLQQRAENI